MSTTSMRRSGALLTLLLLGLGVVTAPPATAVTVTVDCAAGPVTLDQTSGDYLLVGACTRVEVTAVNSTVRLTTADEVVISVPGVTFSATGTVGKLKLVKLAGGVAVTAPTVRSVRSVGATMRFDVGKVGTFQASGPYADVHIGRARRAIIGSDVSMFVFDRLGRLDIDSSTTKVRVRKGSTRVHDTGFRTTIRVHRRR